MLYINQCIFYSINKLSVTNIHNKVKIKSFLVNFKQEEKQKHTELSRLACPIRTSLTAYGASKTWSSLEYTPIDDICLFNQNVNKY